MGTASTMGSIAEALGMMLPGGSSIPAVLSEHARLAAATGRRIVQMVWEDLKPSDILTPGSFENAIVTDMAISGSTNAIVHLIALGTASRHSTDDGRFRSTFTDDTGRRQHPSRRQILDGRLL